MPETKAPPKRAKAENAIVTAPPRSTRSLEPVAKRYARAAKPELQRLSGDDTVVVTTPVGCQLELTAQEIRKEFLRSFRSRCGQMIDAAMEAQLDDWNANRTPDVA